MWSIFQGATFDSIAIEISLDGAKVLVTWTFGIKYTRKYNRYNMIKLGSFSHDKWYISSSSHGCLNISCH